MRPVKSLYYPDNLIKGQRKASRDIPWYMYGCMYKQYILNSSDEIQLRQTHTDKI